MNDFIDVITSYSLSDIVIVCGGVYAAYYFIKKRIKEHNAEIRKDREGYHHEQREIEQHEETIESRLTSLETKVEELSDVHNRLDTLENQQRKHDQWIGNDKAQIVGLGTQITEMTEQIGKVGASVLELDDALTDLRLKSMREFILNAVSVCIDMAKPVSLEFYLNLKKTHEEYEELLKAKGKSNGYCSEAMKIIEASQLRRAECGSFTDQLYIAPDKNKLRETASYHPEWFDKKEGENEK